MNHSDALNFWIAQTQKNQKKAPLPKRFYDVRKRPTHRRHVRKAENLAREGMTEQLEARRSNLTD